MVKQICMQNVSVLAKNRVCFENFSFSFSEKKDVCLIGKEGCGKTTLLRAILGDIKFKGNIVKEANCQGLIHVSLKEDLTILEFLNYNRLDDKEKKMVLQYLKLKSLDYPVNQLNLKFRIKVYLLSFILQKPTFFFLDDLLYEFSYEEKKELFSLFHKYKITLFYVTSNLEDALNFPYMIVMGKNKILMEGPTLSILNEEKILKRLGFSLPFLFDLSLQLQSYNLIDKVYFSRKELVDVLWKLK